MPGIVGIVSDTAFDEQIFNRMMDTLKHEEFFQTEKYCGPNFGFSRIHLAIFNPEDQPIFNEDKSLCIFMDGKIYNYGQQMDYLKNKGYKFNNENDPEFCLHSYEEYGKDFIKGLNGAFVFLIYDFINKKVIIANDRFGFRVHYYAINNGKLYFAPEVKAILQDKAFKREINSEAVADFFAFGEFVDDKTFFREIKIMAPASIITYYRGNLTVEKYWEFKYEADYDKSEDEFVSDLIRTFKKSVEIRMEDKLHYGIGLSGGLDSRTVLAGLIPEKRKDIIAYTFGKKDCNEVKIAKKVAHRMGINHFILEATPEIIMESSERGVWLTDGRNSIGFSHAYPIFALIRDKIDVIFDGWALDLTLGGSYLGKDVMECKSEDLLANMLFNKRRLFKDSELQNLFSSNYYNMIKDVPAKSFKDEINKIKTHHPGNKSDEYAMATHVEWLPIMDVGVRNFIEVSHPTADNDFIDLLLKIPPEWRINHYIYRKFLKELSPELSKIPYNRTMVRADAPLLLWNAGYKFIKIKKLIKKKINKFSKWKIYLPDNRKNVNFDEWFHISENWQIFSKELLLSESDEFDKYFNRDYIEKLYQEQITRKKDNSIKLVHLASFKIFLKMCTNNWKL